MPKVFHISRNKPADFDEMAAAVVIAYSPKGARKFAADAAKGESHNEWLDPERSTVKEVGCARTPGQLGILLEEVKWG